MNKKDIVGFGRSPIAQLFGIQAALAALFPQQKSVPAKKSTAFQQIIPGIRNRKDPVKKAAIERRRKATKLHSLSRSKRRAVYYFNLRHQTSKMFA